MKELSNQLVKLEALVELLNPEATILKIACQMDKARMQKEDSVNEWRKNIDQFIAEYFRKFKIEKLAIACQKNELKSKLAPLGLTSSMKALWINENCVEIIGACAEVDKLVKNLGDSTNVRQIVISKKKCLN